MLLFQVNLSYTLGSDQNGRNEMILRMWENDSIVLHLISNENAV